LDSQSLYGCSLLQIKWALFSWNYFNILKVLNFKQHPRLLKRKTNWHVAGNFGYCPTLALSANRHLRPPHVWRSESFLDKTYWRYQHQPQCIWQIKSCSFERSTLNCHKFKSNCVLKEGLLACKNFDILKTYKSGCTLDGIHFTNKTTGHNRFSVIEELS